MSVRALADGFSQDLSYAVRTLRTSPAFAAIAIFSLALGIGANTAIFSIIDAVMLKTLPVANPGELVTVSLRSGADRPQAYYTYTIWDELRRRQTAFSSMLAWGTPRFNVAGRGETQFAEGMWVSGEFFSTLGVRAQTGRTITGADDVVGAAPVAVISHGFWRKQYGGAPDVVGKTIDVDHHPFQIVGIVEPGFTGIDVGRGFDVAVPITTELIVHADRPSLPGRSSWWIRVMGRLKPGVTKEQAVAQLNAIAPEVMKASAPPNWRGDLQSRFLNYRFALAPAGNGVSGLRTQYGNALFTLMAIVGSVLLIGCANIANLLLARATAREKEIAVRLAIGATRRRLIRQLLTEALVVSLAGAALGIAFAHWGSALLVRLISETRSPVYLDLAVDLRMLAFTVAVAILTGVLFGLVPAFRATSVAPNSAMKENSRGLTLRRGRFGLGKVLVVSQVSLSLVLLVGAALFVRSLRNLLTVDLGFRKENVLIVSVDVRDGNIRPENRRPAYEEMLKRLSALPGVRAASQSAMTPISGYFWNQTVIADGQPAKSGDAGLMYFNRVTPRYFDVMGTPFLAGRTFGPQDTPQSPAVAIINETAAKHFFGSGAPIGRIFQLQGAPNTRPTPVQVVGVVKDAKYGAVRDEVPSTGYMASSQEDIPRASTSFELYSTADVASLTPAIRQALHEVDRGTVIEFQTLERQVNESINKERVVALLSGFFGFLAVLLATVGLYGVMSYTVNRRRGEIGIRMALGAAQGNVVWLIVREVALLVISGSVVGLAGAIAGARLISTMLYNVKPTDAGTITVACAMLAGTALLAGYIPALRASRVDPMTALRDE
jgi:predicted permease